MKTGFALVVSWLQLYRDKNIQFIYLSKIAAKHHEINYRRPDNRCAKKMNQSVFHSLLYKNEITVEVHTTSHFIILI